MLRNLTDWQLHFLAIAVVFATAFCCAQKSSSASTADSPLSTAKTQLENGDLDSGEKTLWSILSAEPNNEAALTMLGVLRAQQQRYAEAEALFRRVLQLNPKSIVASRYLASALLAEDKPDEAIKQYEQAIRLAPLNYDLKIELARLHLERGDFAGALSTLDAIKPDRFPPSAIPLKAASLLGVGRRSDAEGLIPLVKSSPGAVVDLAEVFVEANDADAALKTLSVLNPPPRTVAAVFYYLKGRALRQKGETSAAMSSFHQALSSDPKSIETLVAMAEIYATEKKHAESFRMLEKAHALNPDSAEVLRHLIVEAMQSGQNDNALQFAQDLQRKSSELDDRYLVASVMLQQKQYTPATHILEDYVAQRPQDAKAFLGLGMAYLNLLRYPEARQALEHSVQINPDLAESQYQLGLLLAQQGNRDEAIKCWEKAVRLQPNHALAQFGLGTMYLEAGELEKAKGAFLLASAADPYNMKTEYDLALVLNKLGKSEEAKQHFERYKKMQEEEHTANGNPPVTTPDHP